MLNSRNFRTGIRLVGNTTLTGSILGDLQSYTVDGQLYYNDGTGNSPILTGSSSSVITNKQLDDSSVYFIDHSDSTLQFHFDAEGTTGTKTTLTSSQTSNRVITLPDATDTLVGRATTDTLTNKSISGSTNTITNISLTTAVTGVLPLINGGTGTAAASANAAYNALSPMTTTGDIEYEVSTGVATRLPIGSSGQVLTVSSGAPAWMPAPAGFTNPMTTAGDIIIGGSGGTPLRLGATTNGFVLTLSSGSPVWAASSGGVTIVGSIDTSPNANGLFISGNTISTQTASASNPGMVSTGTQTFAGSKTFTSNTAVPALIMTQVSTPSTPASGHNDLYFKSDGFLYMLDSNGVETLVSPGISGTSTNNNLTFTTSGFGTITSSDFRYRRIGDVMVVSGSFLSGTTTATSMQLILPAGYTIDSTKISNNASGQVVGLAEVVTNASSSGASATVGPWPIFFDGSDTAKLYIANNTTSKIFTKGVGTNLTSGDGLQFEFEIPITGWTVNNGSTIGGNPMTTLGDIIIGGVAGAANRLGIGSTGQVLTVVSGSPTWAASGGGGSSFDYFASSQVTTDSSAFTSTTFTTFSNSPGFSFTPNFTGKYKVYASAGLEGTVGSSDSFIRIANTVGGASLLNEQSAGFFDPVGGNFSSSLYTQSVFTLTASTSYTFEIQGKVDPGGACKLLGAGSYNFYLFAERIG